ncbi:MAG: TIGR04086 family membrane protein [Acidimicrobiaceae bacterium]|nr:TIGR04086 family membrane protein [Acidimicrobiaceae bacterium]MXW75485.1 TIGR04086 family membrane protein [Acidimicrobiaceae bacterium]MYA73915.1 TIGR04086 family membrane protein [Acidimicrobiaceae bacterium]MYC43890.1 TIGR04086 family membrane protein [Acidimicrobiaceae bacterium]MYD05933.1 TIGR04086 family membrane protein [Acidimicrobiaceae bacterium]
MSESLFPPAVRAGALTCLAISAPAAVVQASLSDSGETNQSNWVYLTLLAIVVAYLLGGAVAGRVATDAPMINGATATLVAFAVVQTVAAVFRIAGGDGINPLALIFNALLAAAIGTVGGGIGAYVANRARVNR